MKRMVAGMLLLLTACGPSDMAQQERIEPYDEHGAIPPPEGSQARDELPRAVALAVPPATDSALIERGSNRFGIFCAPCHGAKGDGVGRVPNIPPPPDLMHPRHDTQRVMRAITHGFGAMPSMAAKLEPRDRWAIAAWLADRRRQP